MDNRRTLSLVSSIDNCFTNINAIFLRNINLTQVLISANSVLIGLQPVKSGILYEKSQSFVL